MAELNCNDLATVCRLEIADAATSDALARRTMEICRKAVNGSSWAKMLCHADIDDIVIIASARAIKRLAKWDRGARGLGDVCISDYPQHHPGSPAL